MGQSKPSTLSNCTFPFTSYPANDLTCSRTYAEASGTPYNSLWIFLLIYMWLCVFLQMAMLPRIFKRYWPDLNWDRGRIPSPLVWNPVTTCITLCFGITSMDLWGWRNQIPIQVYTIFDDMAACLTLCLVVDVVSAWKRGVSMMHSKGLLKGFTLRYRIFLWTSIFLSSVGAEIAGISDPPHYKIYNGVGVLVLACIIGYLLVLSCIYIHDIFSVLQHSNGGAGTSKTSQGLRVLRNKFISFTVPALATTIIWLWNGISYLTSSSYAWDFEFAAKPGNTLIFARVVSLLVATGLLFMFANPLRPLATSNTKQVVTDGESTSHNNNKKKDGGMMMTPHQSTSGGGGNNNNHVVSSSNRSLAHDNNNNNNKLESEESNPSHLSVRIDT
jgi:hypothetical protein